MQNVKPLDVDTTSPVVSIDPDDPSRATASEPLELQLERAQRAMRGLLEATLPERFTHPDWYLTGVQVGLKSLRRLHRASHMVYKHGNDRGVGARKMDNLAHVFARLEEFEAADGLDARTRIFIEEKDAFERLLMDFEDAEKSAGFQREHLTLIEQVAKDVMRATNRLRTLDNLIAAIGAIPQIGWLQSKGWRKPKRRNAALDELMHTYAATLARYGVASVEDIVAAPKLQSLLRKVKDEAKRTRRHVTAIRDEMYREQRALITAPEKPEVDLEPAKVIEFLKGASAAGLEYLLRAYAVYAHAADTVVGGSDLLARVRWLKQQLEENEPLTEDELQRDPTAPVIVRLQPRAPEQVGLPLPADTNTPPGLWPETN
ncbi:MAG: hypothetical protein U0610_30660 [bacterium]